MHPQDIDVPVLVSQDIVDRYKLYASKVRLTLKRLKRPPGILELLLCSATCSSCARTSTPDPLGAAPPDIVPLGPYMSPSSATLRTPTLRANVTAWAEGALNKIRAFKVSAEVCAVSTPGH